jgi:hypothetical protein
MIPMIMSCDLRYLVPLRSGWSPIWWPIPRPLWLRSMLVCNIGLTNTMLTSLGDVGDVSCVALFGGVVGALGPVCVNSVTSM